VQGTADWRVPKEARDHGFHRMMTLFGVAVPLCKVPVAALILDEIF